VLVLAAGADGNGRDRSLLTWRDCVLAEAVKSAYEVQFHVVLRLNGGG
jgi:hypothetical protein